MLRASACGCWAGINKHTKTLSPAKARFGAVPVPDPEVLVLDPAVLVLNPAVLILHPQRNTLGHTAFFPKNNYSTIYLAWGGGGVYLLSTNYIR